MQLDRVLDSPLLDPASTDLARADRVQYLLEQRFTYEYDQPIHDLHHRLVVVPPVRHGEQFRRAHRLTVDGAEVRRRSRSDGHGNPVVVLAARTVERRLDLALLAVLERVSGSGPALLAPGTLDDPRWRQPTRLTRPSLELHALAYAASSGIREPAEQAAALCRATFEAMRYEYGVTAIDTTAAEALTVGRGVCQDYAHVMIAMCHAVGIAARYVSGHLIGQGGTHAWVEVAVVKGGSVELIALDPCNDRLADRRYLTIATGRDYRSVAPTSGRFTASGTAAVTGRLTTSRRVGVLRAA